MVERICLAALSILTYANAAQADASSCSTSTECSGGPYSDPVGEQQFKVDSSTCPVNGTDMLEFVEAAILASEEWNQNSNGRYFRYTGTVDMGGDPLPVFQSDCDADNHEFSLIFCTDDIRDHQGVAKSTFAFTEARCRDSDRTNGRQFLIQINFDPDSAGGWGIGDISSGANEKDLVSTLTHELGHTVQLGDLTGSHKGIMSASTTDTTLRRSIYQHDLECQPACAGGSRQLTAYRRHLSSGVYGSETALPGSGHLVDVSSGFTYDGSSWLSSYAYTKDTGFYWGKQTAAPVAISDIPDEVGIGPLDTVWREDSNRQRVFWSSYEEYPTSYDASSSHKVYYSRSDNEYSSSTWGVLQYCTVMWSWMTCSAFPMHKEILYSGQPLAVAWEDVSGASVTAWTTQNRLDNSDEREINIAVGYIENNLLPVPFQTGLKSSVPPAVACHGNFSGSWDCILAFVAVSDPHNRVKVIRFSVSAGGTYQWDVTLDSAGASYLYVDANTSAKTGARIAAAWNDGRFRIVIKAAKQNQNLEAYSSSNGTTWTWDSSNLGYSVVRPSFGSIIGGTSNYLATVR